MSAPIYFAESISSETGFWGIRCENYFDFLIGRCGEVDLDGEDEDEEDILFRNYMRRMNGVPQGIQDEADDTTRSKRVKLQWQLMGEHCNLR